METFFNYDRFSFEIFVITSQDLFVDAIYFRQIFVNSSQNLSSIKTNLLILYKH